MKLKYSAAILGCITLTMLFFYSKAQTKAVLFEGIATAGYVDHGAFINCAGPGVKFVKKPYLFMMGLLPSLRIKKDKVAPGATKNSMLTPNLGFGLTAAYHHVAFQVPLYYNTKTALKNGEWNVGLGLGYKF